MKKLSHFADQQTAELMCRVNAGESTSVLGIAGSGITIFLQHITNEIVEDASYVNIASLPSPCMKEFHTAVLHSLGGKAAKSDTTDDIVTRSMELIQDRLDGGGRIIIVIAGFDHLQPEFSSRFFHYLQVINAIDSKRVIFVFGTCRRLDSILPLDLIDTNIRLFASTYYLRPFSENDCRYLLSKYEDHHQLDHNTISKLIRLSGGHFQLLQLLINSEQKNDPVNDPYIQLVFRNILSHLSTSQKNSIKKLAVDDKYDTNDTYLTNVGIVIQTDKSYILFSELFTEYVQKHYSLRLPIKERRLLAVLKKNEGRVVTKHEIYDAVWRGNDVGSEWALNALIYRLRRHPAFLSQSYEIENYKKIGYLLIKA